MAKLISRTEKRGRGRPATNPKSIHLTLEPGPLSEVDQWIARQKESRLTRPEAIRRLVEIGLAYPIKADEIVARQLHALCQYRRPHEKKLRLSDVKRLFELMRVRK